MYLLTLLSAFSYSVYCLTKSKEIDWLWSGSLTTFITTILVYRERDLIEKVAFEVSKKKSLLWSVVE